MSTFKQPVPTHLVAIISIAMCLSHNATAAIADDAIQVSGRVLDAKTGLPIKSKVHVVAASANTRTIQSGEFGWQNHLRKSFDGGAIDFRMKRGYSQTIVRIDADGYRPFVTPIVQKNEPMTQDFILHPESIQGIVLTPDGKPAVDAEVAISTWTLELNVKAGKIEPGYNWKDFGRSVVKTDSNGRFILPAEIDPLTVVATHSTGYAQQPVRPPSTKPTPNPSAKPKAPVLPSAVSQSNNKPSVKTATTIGATKANPRDLRLQLQAWGSVSGQLVGADDKPIQGRTLWISGGWPGRNDPGHISHRATIETDKDGQFSIDRMAPGTGNIQHGFKNADGTGSFSPIGLTSQYNLPAGEALNLTVGKAEKPLVGRVVLPDEMKDDLSTAKFNVFLHDTSWKYRNPGAKSVSYPKWDAFNTSNAGARYRLNGTAAELPERIQIDQDGNFEINGLPTARYVLQIRLGKGFAAKRFVMPLNTREPVDIGDIALRMSK